MSLFELRIGPTLSPRVQVEGERLEVRTGLLARVLSAGLVDRRVTVDRARETIEVRTRFSTRSVPFARVSHIDYAFEAVPTDYSLIGTTNTIEVFSVSAILKEPREEVVLARFRGEGSVSTGMAGVVLGDSLVDVRGSQQEGSQQFLALVQRFLDVPLGRPVPAVAGARRCACGRTSPPRLDRCQYCGERFEAEETTERCSLCKGPLIDARNAVIACPDCGTRQHRGCALEFGRCATHGCEATFGRMAASEAR